MILSDYQKKRVHLTPEEASDFYLEHFGKLFFPSLIAYMSNGPIQVLVLSHENAISLWRDIIGPTNAMKAKITNPDRLFHSHSTINIYGTRNSLRAIYGTDDQQNGFHGSDSFSSAEREIRFFYPEGNTDTINIDQYPPICSCRRCDRAYSHWPGSEGLSGEER